MNKNKRDLCDRTFQFALRIVKLCNELSKSPGVGRTMANQLLRSGTSIGANVEEGQGAQSEADFVAKYSIARKEARETHYWLRLLAESKIVEPAKLTGLITENVSTLLTDARAYASMANAVNPYGDGKACERILAALEN